MKKKSLLFFLLLLLISGLLRFSPEKKLTHHLQEQGLLSQTVLDLDIREQLGQMSFAVMLGGFRSLIASLLNIRAYIAWENVDWGKIESLYTLMTQLQPNALFYWEYGSWHLGFNASAHYLMKKELSPKLRQHYHDTYVQKARAFLEKGFKHQGESGRLYAKMAFLLDKKANDPCSAAHFYQKASLYPDTPTYMRRFAAYKKTECAQAGKENPWSAYFALLNLYLLGEDQHLPSLLTHLQELEKQLHIPTFLRIQRPKIHPSPLQIYRKLSAKPFSATF